MLVAQTATVAGPNQHSAARNAFVFVLKTDNFWFVPRQYNSALEHIHNMFAVCLLTVHSSEHHVLDSRVRLCREYVPQSVSALRFIRCIYYHYNTSTCLYIRIVILHFWRARRGIYPTVPRYSKINPHQNLLFFLGLKKEI